MNNRTVMYDNVNKHLAQLMSERQVIMFPELHKDTVVTDEDIQKIPLIEKAIDEGRKFYQPIK